MASIIKKDESISSLTALNNDSDREHPRRRRRASRKKESENVDSFNWRIHEQYVQNNFEECEKTIELALREGKNQCEYAMFMKGVILKNRGCLSEAQSIFQQVLDMCPSNYHVSLQIARCLYLSGNFPAALELYQKIGKSKNTWRLHHCTSLCLARLERLEDAERSVGQALAIYNNAVSLCHLARVRTAAGDIIGAIKAYEQAHRLSPEDTDIITDLGLLHLRLGNTGRAFELFGSCLSIDPRDSKAILAAGSIIQNNEDFDVALVKYRISAVLTPESAELWNNIGMCFFGKRKHVAAIACLKRAAYLAPFEWMIAFNLGLVHLSVGQLASAFHFLSASVNLRPSLAPAFGLLGVTLHRLHDHANAKKSFLRAIELDSSDPLVRINFAIFHLSHNDVSSAKEQIDAFQRIAAESHDFEQQHADCLDAAQKVKEKLTSQLNAENSGGLEKENEPDRILVDDSSTTELHV
eukprot:gene3823-6333_t